MLHLFICHDNDTSWINHPTYENAKANEDVGLDVPQPANITVPKKSKAFKIDLGYKSNQNMGYMLVPRSSISKTPLRLANSIGIIDKNYTGKVLVKVDNNSNDDYVIEEGQCYFQIVAFDGNLPSYELVSEIKKTRRGSGGFGSTTF